MLFQIIILIILILLNAYFAASEMAYISLNDAKIEKEAKEGNKKAKKIKKMLKNPSKFLATIQIGITLAGFLSSAFAADTFASELSPILNEWIPGLGIGFWQALSIIVITIILSFFTLIFGELVPKRLAMKYSEKIAYATIGIISFISILTSPFVKLLTATTNLVSKIFGVSEYEEEVVTEEEIKMMVDQGQEKGVIKKNEKDLINNVFLLNDIDAAEIMIHRTDIFAIEINDNIYELLDEIDDYKYSRIPVYEETIDDIKGILFLKDILKALSNGKKIKIKDIMREAYYVPETKPIDEVFKELQKNKMQMAIVVDEYGGTSGLLTMEDILEELVGNIFDEYDDVEVEYNKIDENTYMVEGSIPLYELKKIIGIEIPEGDYDTLSGYLIEKLGRIPEDDEKPVIEDEKLTYKVEELEDKRIKWVKICKNQEVSVNEDDENKEQKKNNEE